MGLRAFWEELPQPHRRWVLWNALAITAVINLVVNVGIGWLSAAGENEVPLWAAPLVGGPSTINQAVGTLFLLPLITCVLCTTAVWHEVRTGRLTPLADMRVAHPVLGRLPATRLRRGLAFGGLSVIALAPIAVIALIATEFGDLSRGGFVLYAGALGVTLGAIVTPLIAVRAMADSEVEGVVHEEDVELTDERMPPVSAPIGGGAGPSNLDAMGLDKRRHVVGQSYGPSLARQATIYGVFLGVIAALAIGFYLLAKELDQPPQTNQDKAPWSAPRAPLVPPQPLE